MNIFWDKYPAEYKSEIKGIADAVAARGGEMFGEKVTYEDILTLNEMYELMSILVNPVKAYIRYARFSTTCLVLLPNLRIKKMSLSPHSLVILLYTTAMGLSPQEMRPPTVRLLPQIPCGAADGGIRITLHRDGISSWTSSLHRETG